MLAHRQQLSHVAFSPQHDIHVTILMEGAQAAEGVVQAPPKGSCKRQSYDLSLGTASHMGAAA